MTLDKNGIAMSSSRAAPLNPNNRYFVTRNGIERKVPLSEYLDAENSAGFHNKFGDRTRPATSSFSRGGPGVVSIAGRIEYAANPAAADNF